MHLLQIGRLMTFLEQSGLAETTYIMLSGDNGPALFSQESKQVPKEVRGSTARKFVVLCMNQTTASRSSVQCRMPVNYWSTTATAVVDWWQ